MNNDLRILITGTLNAGKSIGEINTAIKGIEKKINSLKLNVQVDDRTTKTLEDFSKAMEKMRTVQQDLQRSYKEEEVVVKKLDGSVEKTTRQYLKSGEVIEKTRKTINEKTKAVEKETEALGKLANEIDNVDGKRQKLITRQDGQGNITGSTEKYSDGFKDTSINFNKDGKETSRTITENIDREEKATKQLTKAKEDLIQKVRILNRENKIDNDTARAVTSLAKETHDVDKIKQYNSSLKDVTSSQKIINKEIQDRVKLQEQENRKAKEVNDWWQKALKEREIKEKQILETQRQQLATSRQDVNKYKQNKLNESARFEQRYGDLLDDNGRKRLDAYNQALHRLDASMPKVNQRMQNLAIGFDNIKTSAMTSAKAVDTSNRSVISFGNAMKTALIKFPINIHVGIKLL